MFFADRYQTIKLLNAGSEIVNQLGTDSPKCPLMGTEIVFGKLLGKGVQGKVYSVTLPKLGNKEYVVKVTRTGVEVSRDTDDPDDFEEDLIEAALDHALPLKLVKSFNPDPSADKIFVPLFQNIPCLTKRPREYTNLATKKPIIVPKGVYMCEDDTFAEYAIALLCSQFVEKHQSANFIEVYDLISCLKPRERYFFMAPIDTTIRDIRHLLFELDDDDKLIYPANDPLELEGLYLQLVHAMAMYQSIGISHNDFHTANVFLKNSRMAPRLVYSYSIYGDKRYLQQHPNYLVKVGDLGLACKYTNVPILNTYIMENGYNNWIPNWFSRAYDLLFITDNLYARNPSSVLLRSSMQFILGLPIEKDTASLAKTRKLALQAGNRRPILTYLYHNLSEMSPVKLLLSEVFRTHFGKKPPGEEQVLGTLV
jgi:serine/threonine protein kinase